MLMIASAHRRRRGSFSPSRHREVAAGMKFGTLTVVACVGVLFSGRSEQMSWRCLCDQCRRRQIIAGSERAGRSACGCSSTKCLGKTRMAEGNGAERFDIRIIWRMVGADLLLPKFSFALLGVLPMRTKAPPKDVLVTTVRLPRDIQAWLRERANHYGTSPNAEMVRLCRLAMDTEAEAKAGRLAITSTA
jgi:hypothetical protein